MPAWTFYLGTQYQAAVESLRAQDHKSIDFVPVPKQKDEVVYLHRDNGDLSLYTINADGSNKRLLYRNKDKLNSNIISPRWSIHNTILFGAMRDGAWKIFSINSDGTGLKLVSDLDMSTNFALSQESRDQDILVNESVEQKEYSLSVVAGGTKTKIYSVGFSVCGTSCTGGLLHEASFSPDKKHVIFEQGNNIMIVGVDGKGARVLTEGVSPDWR
jgi:Tol biopolymer transport system component